MRLSALLRGLPASHAPEQSKAKKVLCGGSLPSRAKDRKSFSQPSGRAGRLSATTPNKGAGTCTAGKIRLNLQKERDGGRSAAMQKNKDAVHCKAFDLWHEMRSLGSVFVQDGTALFARQTVPEPFLLSRTSSWKDCSDKLDLLA